MYEPSTEHVIDWLSYHNIPFQRINGIDFLKEVSIEISNVRLSIKIRDIDWQKVNVIWFRRWLSPLDAEELMLNIKNKIGEIDPLAIQFNEILRNELKSLVAFFLNSLPKEKLFCRTKPDEINKLSVLNKARELTINIPETSIFTKKNDLLRLLYGKKIVTKSIDNSNSLRANNVSYASYTSLVEDLPSILGDYFAASLFQTLIDKKFEIRTFLLSGRFYSMAIFSQDDKQTEIDFRKYNFIDPNRVVPYQLPQSLEIKLLQLASFFEINSGSFDLIMTKSEEIVFLEVNPGGQFGMVSYPCNYFLERELAYELSKF